MTREFDRVVNIHRGADIIVRYRERGHENLLRNKLGKGFRTDWTWISRREYS